MSEKIHKLMMRISEQLNRENNDRESVRPVLCDGVPQIKSLERLVKTKKLSGLLLSRVDISTGSIIGLYYELYAADHSFYRFPKKALVEAKVLRGQNDMLFGQDLHNKGEENEYKHLHLSFDDGYVQVFADLFNPRYKG